MLFYGQALFAKVLLLTHSYNRPDFIALQEATFKRFLQDEYEFVVFNDGPTPKLARKIEEECAQLGIRCVSIPQEIHQQPYLTRQPWEDVNCPSVRTANALQYSFNTLGFQHEGLVAVVDSDMFLIREFSIEEYLGDASIAAVGQWRGSMGCIQYIWNGIMFFNMETLPNKHTLNFNCGTVLGNHTDTGGFTYYYFQQNPEVRVKYMRGQVDLTDGDCIADSYTLEDREYLSQEEVLERVAYSQPLVQLIKAPPDDIQFFLDFAFLHYRRAGNYNSKSHNYHQGKTQNFENFIHHILQ
jgi:hypothetical protein